MGTCYYLVRRDNRTAYDLGKSYGWDGAFAYPMVLRVGDVDTLVDLIVQASEPYGWCQNKEDRVYLRIVALDIVDWSEGQPFEYHSEHSGLIEDLYMEGWVALDIVDWSEGQPFEYHSEHSGLIEDLYMEGWDLNTPLRKWITGDRHTGHMIDEFRERHNL